jgi:hypothetical protein
MTPKLASQILERNINNRSVRPNMVRQIVNDIKCGRWMLNPQPVSIASDGTLLDGQHRLMAVVQAGQAVQMMLASNCQAECFATIDTGNPRTPGDILKVEGASNYTIVASIIRVASLYCWYPGNVWTGTHMAVSKQQILQAYRRDTAAWDKAATLTQKYGKKAPCILKSAVGAFLWLYGSQHAPRADDKEFSVEYLRRYSTGEMLEAGNPILAFRNWQSVQWKVAQVRLAQTQLACHIKAYSYWRAGTQLKIFKQPQIPPMPEL